MSTKPLPVPLSNTLLYKVKRATTVFVVGDIVELSEFPKINDTEATFVGVFTAAGADGVQDSVTYTVEYLEVIENTAEIRQIKNTIHLLGIFREQLLTLLGSAQ